MNFMTTLAPLLRSQRIRLGMTIRVAADLAEVSPVTFSALENGQRTDCSLETCRRACEAVGLELTIGIRGQTQAPAIPPTTRQRVRRRP